MEIAIVAHDKKKELMAEFCTAYCGILCKHNLYATSITAKYISEATGLEIEKLLTGEYLYERKHCKNCRENPSKRKEILDKGGDPQEARKLATENIKENPKHIDSYLMVASIDRNARDYASAMRIVEQAMKNNHKNKNFRIL